jgi:hypothetical protein
MFAVVYEYAQSRSASDPDMVDMLVEPDQEQTGDGDSKKILFPEVNNIEAWFCARLWRCVYPIFLIVIVAQKQK